VILLDTSIWIDHLRARDEAAETLLQSRQVLVHPFIVGELALGNLRQRETILGSLRTMPHAIVATDEEVFSLISANKLFGLGIGYVDAHLIAATRLTAGARFWTRDKRLLSVAERLGLHWTPN
jgi:predicted nucleic acid-binding protein